MLLGMASVPGTGAVLLFRRALRRIETDRPALEATPTVVQPQPPATELPDAVTSEPVTVDEVAATGEPASAAPEPSASVASTSRTPLDRRGGLPWMTRLQPALRNLIGTSFGRGVLTAVISVPLMIAWRDAAPSIGPMALTIFSLVDPLPMATKPSWWRNAFVSGTVWFVLFLLTNATADIVSDQPDIVIGFILPLLAYPAAMAVSALIRMMRWLST
jgi:hypothetical protein